MGRARAKWNAAAHPRDPRTGRFIKAGGGGSDRGSVLGTLARNAAANPPTPSRRGTAAQRMAATPRGGGAWSAMATAAKSAQDARVRAATRDRVAADIAETRRQQDIASRAPARGGRSLVGGDARDWGSADKIRAAEMMFGSDRSKWPAHAKRDLAKLDKGGDLPGARGKMRGGRGPVDTADVARQIDAMRDRIGASAQHGVNEDDVDAMLAPLTLAQLQDVYNRIGGTTKLSGNKQRRIRMVSRLGVGSTLDSHAINPYQRSGYVPDSRSRY